MFFMMLLVMLEADDLQHLQQLFDAKSYQAVVSEAKQNTALYSQPKLHLLWAKSAQILGDDISAMSAYERVVMLDPKNRDAQIALISLYEKLKRSMLSQELRDTLMQQELTPQQRAALYKVDHNYDYRIRVMAKLGVGYDNNIGANNDRLRNENDQDPVISTLFSRAVLALNGTYFLDDATHWYLQGDLSGWLQSNQDASYYNAYDGEAAIGLGYRNAYVTLLLPLSYERLYYLERDLLSAYGTKPYLNVKLNNTMHVQLSTTMQQRRYNNEEDTYRDDTILGFGGGTFWYFDHAFFYLKGGYDVYRAEQSQSALFTDKTILFGDLGYSTLLGAWKLRADYHYRKLNFEDSVTQALQSFKREDHYHQVDLLLGRVINTHWSLDLEYRYIRNTSHYEIAEYEKQITMLNLHYGF
jgi:hypothetical protein